MTTKQLFLLRHAKSSRADPELADFDRPLAQRGLEEAPSVGRLIMRCGWIPQKALVSAALRTRDTWRLVAAEWPEPPKAEFTRLLYEASAQDVLAAIRTTAAETMSLLIVGHNPGLERLAICLAGEKSDAELSDRMNEKFPTAALARFEIEGDWQNLQADAARLTHFVRPGDAV